MVVRFTQSTHGQQAHGQATASERDRDNLAEVIELRSRLPLLRPHADKSQNPGTDAAVAPRAELIVLPTVTGHEGWSVAETEPSAATSDAIRLLARKARSSGELRRELAALGHDSIEIEAVVLDCESSLYLDDMGLARVLCESLREKKRASRAQIRMKLKERLLPDAVIEEVLGELDEDEEHELLKQAAVDRARKMRGVDRQTAERRLLAFLARRGWSGERALRVAREALDNTEARGAVRFI